MLSQYIQSFKKGLWDDSQLPTKWVVWYAILKKTNGYKSFEFDAKNSNEYVEALSDMLPYLTREDIEFLYEKVNNNTDCYFAGPSLLINEAHRVMQTGKVVKSITRSFRWSAIGTDIEYEVDKYYLSKHYVDIYRSLYGNKNRFDLPFVEKAVAYSKENWGELLSDIPHMDNLRHNFSNPANTKTFVGSPAHVFTLFVLLNNYNIIVNDRSKSQSQVINDAISLITHDSIIYDEIAGNSGEYDTSPICIYDGSSLDSKCCTICKKTFNKSSHNMYGGPPIGEKLFEYLKNNESRIKIFYEIDPALTIVPDKTLLIQARSNE